MKITTPLRCEVIPGDNENGVTLISLLFIELFGSNLEEHTGHDFKLTLKQNIEPWFDRKCH